ncbi:MAG: hypothetical protein KDJ37_05495 [Hyphomicrobiaceae bacterium]|nr:hypothetical protein [Hyphomicrobiaceae bacterium]
MMSNWGEGPFDSTRVRPRPVGIRPRRTLLLLLAAIALFTAPAPWLETRHEARAQSAIDRKATTAAQAANSRVVLDVPQGYVAAKLYSGFENQSTGVSFVIFEAPVEAYPEMAAAFTAEALAKRGIEAAEAGEISIAAPHRYMRARQSTPNGAYAKYFLLFQTSDQTVLLSANVPMAALEGGRVTRNEIESILASARTVTVTADKPIYTLGYLGPFREAGRIAGTSTLYTLDGKTQSKPSEAVRPLLIVAPSIDARQITNADETARTMIGQLAGFEDPVFGLTERETVAGRTGVELTARATDSSSRAAVEIYQLLLIGKSGGYTRVVGIAPADRASELIPEFRKIALSLSFAEDDGGGAR